SLTTAIDKVVAGTTTVNNINISVINALSEFLPLNFFKINLCSGENNTAKVMAHKMGSKKGLSKNINARLAAIKRVKKKICLIKTKLLYSGLSFLSSVFVFVSEL
ncbi:MAG: hypothetical protein ACR2PU_00130, partial [Gammaproteobacteria bacterium]